MTGTLFDLLKSRLPKACTHPVETRVERIMRRNRERDAYDAEKARTGWHKYAYLPPPYGDVVEFRRYGWDGPAFCRSDELSPEGNAYGLWWRPIQHEITGEDFPHTIRRVEPGTRLIPTKIADDRPHARLHHHHDRIGRVGRLIDHNNG